jgi:glycosyltransferase involved in cell wall biosynthesis
MRITFLLVQDLELSSGGPGRYLPLARELVKMGHSVTLLALHPDFQNARRRLWTEDGVDIRYVGQMHVRKSTAGKTYFSQRQLALVAIASTLRMARAALAVKTDALHVAKAQPINGAAGLIASVLTRLPLYVDCDDFESLSNRFYAAGQSTVVSLFEEGLLPRLATGVTSNTRFMARHMAERGVSSARICYVPNGISRDRFDSVDTVEVEGLRDSLGLRGRRIVGYVGSLSLANHAVDLLIRAWPQVVRAEASAVLLLVGTGEDADKVKQQMDEGGLNDSVRLIGWVPPARVGAYYRLAITTVDPVLDDLTAAGRCPLKLIESIAAGVPVVTGDVGDRRELLADGRAGVLVRPGEAGDLADGILRVITDEGYRDQMAAVSRTLRERYFWDVLAKEFERVYLPRIKAPLAEAQ